MRGTSGGEENAKFYAVAEEHVLSLGTSILNRLPKVTLDQVLNDAVDSTVQNKPAVHYMPYRKLFFT